MNQGDPSRIKLGVDAIVPPSVPPPDTPSKISEQEVSRYEKGAAAARLTPTDRICAAHTSHIAYLEVQNLRLLEESKSLQVRLDRIQPRYAALLQASTTNSWIDLAGIIGMAVGGGIISAASFAVIAEPYNHYCFAGGIVAMFLGAGIMIYTKMLCWPRGEKDGI